MVHPKAARLIQYSKKIPYDTEDLTFGLGEFTVPVQEAEKMLEESQKARNKVVS